jgi:thioredoxin 1
MKKILYFSAAWCGPCKQFGPVMEQVGQSVRVEKVDVDKLPDLAQAYNVRSVPTVVILKDGQEVNRFVGVKPQSLILESVNNA